MITASLEQQHPLFNVVSPLYQSDKVKRFISNEVTETLILCRIAQVRLSSLGKADPLVEGAQKAAQATAEALRQYDMKMRTRIGDQAERASFTQELCKEKLTDIGEMISIAMRATTGESDYEAYMYMIVQFLNRLMNAQANNTALNMNKYKTLMALVTDELKADAEGGTTMFDYCDTTGEVTVQMVHPNNIVNAKLVAG